VVVTNGLLVSDTQGNWRLHLPDAPPATTTAAIPTTDRADLSRPACCRTPAPARRRAGHRRLDRSGMVSTTPLAAFGVTAAWRQVSRPPSVASPFWAFMTSSGVVWDDGAYVSGPLPQPFYATGYLITEAYWASAKVAGAYRDVLIQCRAPPPHLHTGQP
jgi:hypothetical protein